MQSTQVDRVRVFEPRPDRAANADPLFADLFTKGRRRVLRSFVANLVLVALGVVIFVRSDVGIAAPGFFVVLFGPSGVLSLRTYLGTVRPMGNLLGGGFRELWPGQGGVLHAGNKVGLRLPGDGDPQWLVLRMAAAKRLQLAGQRRVWVLGPGPRGHALVLLPGAVVGTLGRVRPEPPDGAEELPLEPRQPCGPNEDPVLLARLADVRRGQVTVITCFAAILAWLAWIWLSVDSASGPVGDFFSGFAPSVAAVFALLAGLVIVSAFRIGRKPVETTWTELAVVTYGDFVLTAAGVASVGGSATLPDGRQATFRLIKVDVNLIVNVIATGRLWIIGPPRQGVRLRVGLPGYPLHGTVKLTA
ncbi:MAG: hypothetical protein JWQ81_6290 [Amycolatopsis sp.]|uniref:hypothetical protein n=1 Tax=Amycolatopsis sp. TaxID=37632 RepID=UPI002604CCA4|nr:hypothetical protein [Amycolatopsis sp.]MCU1685551.1 hypothetical protein [Amycolatopsis sp.]